MAQLSIDLSGRAGLPNKSGTDIYKNLTEPNLRYLAAEGQMVEGVYNPFRLYGYMSPVTHSTRAVTAASGSFGDVLSSRAYDVKNDDLYFGGESSLWRADGLDDTSLANDINVAFDHNIGHNGFDFNSNGTKLIVGSEEGVFAFDLTTAWDVSSREYNGEYFTSAQFSTVRDVQIKDDETKLIVLDTNGVLYEFDITFTGDISTASYAGNKKDLSGDAVIIDSFYYETSDGFIYLAIPDESVGNQTAYIYKYGINGWDVSSISGPSTEFSIEDDIVTNPAQSASSVVVGNGQKTVIVSDELGGALFEYTLGSQSDLSSVILPRTAADLEEDSTQYFSIANADITGLHFDADFTFEGWVKLESSPSSSYTIVDTYNATGDTGYIVTYDGSQFTFQHGDSNSSESASVSASLSTGSWTHVAVVYTETSDFELYINGTSQGTGALTKGHSASAEDFEMGNTFDGKMFDVRMWSDVRTGTEISNNKDDFVESSSANLVANWHFQDKQFDHNPLVDQTSNDNDLTNNNSITFPEGVPSPFLQADVPVKHDISVAELDDIYIRSNGTDLTVFEADETFFDFDMSSAWDITTTSYSGTSTTINDTTTTDITDVTVYRIDGRNALYYGFNTASSGVLQYQIGQYDLDRSVQNDDWMREDADGAPKELTSAPFFRHADNGFLYAFVNDTVYKIDGTESGGDNGAMRNVLEFVGGFYIDDAQDYRGNLYIAIHKGEDPTSNQNYDNECGVYIWDRISSQSRMRDYIRIQGAIRVRAIWSGHDGSLMAITEGANQKTQLRQFSGQQFQILHEFDRNGHPTDSDAITQGPNASWWTGENGRAYAYGRVGPGDDNGLYDFGELLPTENLTVGTMFYGGNSAGSVSGDNWGDVESFYVTYGDDGTPAVKLWAPHANQDGDYTVQSIEQGDVYTPIQFLNQMSTLKNIEIYCAPTDSTGSTTIATLKFYANQSSTAFTTKDITLDDANRGYVDIELNKPYTNSFQMEIEWNTSQALDDDVFAPAQAVLFYEPTNTKG